jgi:hypothetical protein
MDIYAGIAGPVAVRAVEILLDVARENQLALAFADHTGLVLAAPARSEAGATDNDKRRCTTNHAAFSIGKNAENFSRN